MDPLVNITLPVYDEERVLAASVRTLIEYLAAHRFPYRYQIVIADNGSTDRTREIARELTQEFSHIKLLELTEKGKGRAIRAGWNVGGDILSFMDIDLASDLAHFEPLIEAVASGEAEVATGNRLGKGSRIEGRRFARELSSRGYNGLVRLALGSQLADHQCGFKAIRADAYALIAPRFADDGWFFDTELLILAQRAGYRIRAIDIRWVDSRESKVSFLGTSLAILQAMSRFEERLRAEGKNASHVHFMLWWQVGKFLISGGIAAALNLVLFALLARGAGLGYVSAIVITSLVVFIASFTMQKLWTFDDFDWQATLPEVLKFALSALVTAAADVLLLRIFIGHFAMDALLAQALALALLACGNFFVYKFLVFRRGAAAL